MVDLVVRNGKVVIPGIGIISAGVAIDQGRIACVSSDASLPKADRTVDARGNYIIPGVVDTHTHIGLFSSFGEEYKSETKAAAAGGVTTLGVYHRISKSYKGYFEECRSAADNYGITDVIFHFGLVSDQHLREMPEYAKYGVTSFKMYMAGIPDIGFLPNDDGYIYQAFGIISRLGKPAIATCHTENGSIAERMKLTLDHSRDDLAVWTETSPNFTEAECIHKAALYARVQNAPLYLVHVNTKEGVEAVARVKSEGQDVIAETCPHYITVSKDQDTEYKPGIIAKTMPPLRERESIERLWQGLRRGTIDCIGTDHIAIRKEQKMLDKGVWGVFPGWQGVQTLLPVMLHEGVGKGRISLERAVEICSSNPAKAFGIYPKKGTIAVGSDADLVIVDLNKEVKVGPEIMKGISDFTLYDGHTLKGWPVMTMLRGEITMENGEVVGHPGTGKYVPRSLGP